MEFLVVSKTKLKAILDKEDMKKYKLEGEGAEGDSLAARRAFREILAVATEEVGFDTERDKVLIQLYPSRDGGGELFVTKLGSLNKNDMRAIKESGNVTILSTLSRLYKFDCLDELILGAKSIKSRDLLSAAYYIDGAYFLYVEERCESGVRSEIVRLSEFAERLPEKLLPYIREQGRELFKSNAVGKLAALAV